MATTFTLTTSKYQGRYLELTCTQTKDIVTNTSTIKWVLTSAGGSVSYYSIGPTTVKIGGTQVYYCDRKGHSTHKFPAAKGSVSGTTVINHDNIGKASIDVSLSTAIYTGTVSTNSGTWTLDPIPRKATITSAPDFTDLDSPTIYFDNPAGSAATVQVCISWDGSDNIRYRDIAAGASSYTFNFTQDELNALYSATTGSNTLYVTFYVWTTINGEEVGTSTLRKTFTVTDCTPDLNPTVEDMGDVSYPLTGNRNTLIRYFNYPKATFNATAKKGASIVSKTVACGPRISNADGDYVQFNNVDSNVFTFTVIDSRGNTVVKNVTMNIIDYVTLSCNPTVTHDLNTDNTIDIDISVTGNYFDGSLGVTNNSLIVEYRYSGNGYQSEWTPINATVAGTTYQAASKITGLDYKSSYTVQVRAKDAIYSGGTLAKDLIVKVFPVFDWGEHDFNFNVPVTIQGKNACTYGADRIARAYTQETDIEYAANSYIKLFRDKSPTDLYNQDIATFNDNGLITINKNMTALINIHIPSSNYTNPNNRSWIKLMNYKDNLKYTDCVNYGLFTTSQITIVLNLSAGTQLGVCTVEPMIINNSALVGSYIEIIEL